MITRHTDTGLEIVASGEFKLIKKRHYQHRASGLGIAYDFKRWAWVTCGRLQSSRLVLAISADFYSD